MKTCLVLGTRPEIVKLSPVIRALSDARADYFILHTGQHYSRNLDEVFFEQLRLPKPRYNLRVGSGSHGEETGKMLIGIERVLLDESPDMVLAEGDTNSVLAGALVASKLHLKLGHVEAGLRSGDMDMPEEVNRIVADHVSNYLFSPTSASRKNLLHEGIDRSRIYVTGNTIVDAVQQNESLALDRSSDQVGSVEGPYAVATIHRQENTDEVGSLRPILEGLQAVSDKLALKVLFFIHPRTRKMIKEFGLSIGNGLVPSEPVDYLTFLRHEAGARLILTDSGGVQEEACILKVPCVTVRDTTERPETVSVGANLVAGRKPKSIVDAASEMVKRNRAWSNPFGDGKSGKRIVDIVLAND